jgi:inosine/xanthosine triphosphate pyrophosphatase family protein
VFLPVAADGVKTMADLTDAEKDTLSHRGIAAAMLLSYLG